MLNVSIIILYFSMELQNLVYWLNHNSSTCFLKEPTCDSQSGWWYKK
jgi:hypothetical protein